MAELYTPNGMKATEPDQHRFQLKRKGKRERTAFSLVIYNVIWPPNAGICLGVICFFPQTQAKAKVEF